MKIRYLFFNEFRIARRDPGVFVILFLMPFAALYLLSPAMRPALILQGYTNASGAEQAMPGMSILFGNFGMAFLAFAIFREHTWNTWSRLKLAPLSGLALFGGKALLPFLLVLSQQFLMLLAGYLIFGVEVRGSLWAFALISFSFSLMIVAAGFMLCAIFSSMQQINAVINFGALLLAGLGGAFAPLETLPAWMRYLSVLSPDYWAISGMKAVILKGAGLWDVLPHSVVLLVLTTSFLSISVYRFSRQDRSLKTWA